MFSSIYQFYAYFRKKRDYFKTRRWIFPKIFQGGNWSVHYTTPEFHAHWKLLRLSNINAKLRKYWSDLVVLNNIVLWDFLLFRVEHNIEFLFTTREMTTLGYLFYHIAV